LELCTSFGNSCNVIPGDVKYDGTVSLDSPSREVTLFDPVSVVYRDATRQAKELHHLKHVGALERGLAYLSRCNSGWFCHTVPQALVTSMVARPEQPPQGVQKAPQPNVRDLFIFSS
jgi:hypothetical protein